MPNPASPTSITAPNIVNPIRIGFVCGLGLLLAAGVDDGHGVGAGVEDGQGVGCGVGAGVAWPTATGVHIATILVFCDMVSGAITCRPFNVQPLNTKPGRTGVGNA